MLTSTLKRHTYEVQGREVLLLRYFIGENKDLFLFSLFSFRNLLVTSNLQYYRSY